MAVVLIGVFVLFVLPTLLWLPHSYKPAPEAYYLALKQL
jgi:hypothetical protein